MLNHESYFPELKSAGDTYAQVFKSSPSEGSDSMRLMYLLSITAAQKRILIANSYFVPDDQSVDALVAAKQRGVQIEIIVPGPKIDTAITRRASRSRWGRLLQAGVEIYEYQPTMYHCKVMVVDDCWVSVGSTNFDNRSFRLNDEANLNAMSPELATEQARVFEDDKRRSRKSRSNNGRTARCGRKSSKPRPVCCDRRSSLPHGHGGPLYGPKRQVSAIEGRGRASSESLIRVRYDDFHA